MTIKSSCSTIPYTMIELNKIYNGFKVLRIVPIEELQCVLYEFSHVASKAKVIHIQNDDPENVFCLSFQTLPTTSNGVAHILEHTVLCGSKKFPIKDPFFSMNRRSLNSFMNALTGADFTCYPAATQNAKDFYNLLEVYLDAVFHPILDERSFMQEGHRLEFESPEDPSSPLVYRGVVFNEMKGALNSGSARMHEALLAALFPDITYGINSGGDPKNIPELTYQNLLDFHHTYYHPSRCLFFFYGNMPVETHLAYINEHILKDAPPLPDLPKIPKQPRFSRPQHHVAAYPVSHGEPMEDKTIISFGWLTCDNLDQEACLALGVLEVILLDTDASPLKKALLQSGLCKQVASYLDTDSSEVPFAIQLKGCNPENVAALESVIRTTLEAIVKEGIPEEAVDNAIHQYEFHRSEITGDYYPYGLTLFMRSCLLMQHGGDPTSGLLIHSLFDDIQKHFANDKNYFTKLIKKWILDNPHFVSVTLIPDPNLESKEREEEKKTLEEIKKNLDDKEANRIIVQTEELKAYQDDEEEDVEVLPKVTLADIPKHIRDYPLATTKAGNLTVYHHNCFTNQIGYADLFFKLPPLSINELIDARLLTLVLTQIGCGGKTYEQTLNALQADTGGCAAYLTLHMQAHDYNSFSPALAVRGKALQRKMPKLFSLLNDFVKAPDFSDLRRLEEILQKHYTALESGLNQNALRYAINLSASKLNAPSNLANRWYGLDYYHMVKKLIEDFASHSKKFSERLHTLSAKIFSQGSKDLVISSDREIYSSLKKEHFYGLADLNKGTDTPFSCGLDLPLIEPQGRIIASPVAFISKVFSTVPYCHPASPALNLSAYLFDNLTLHKKIREEGGAYGAGAVCNALSGNYYFYSYRDPNIASSLAAFEEAIHHVLEGQFDDGDLEEAKMEIIQNFDHPISPGSRADAAYNWQEEGKTKELRQQFRERLLAIKAEDLMEAIRDHLLPAFHQGTPVVFAGIDLLQTENEKLEAEGQRPLHLFALSHDS